MGILPMSYGYARVAHALVRAASPLLAMTAEACCTRPGVEMSLDTARKSACATS